MPYGREGSPEGGVGWEGRQRIDGDGNSGLRAQDGEGGGKGGSQLLISHDPPTVAYDLAALRLSDYPKIVGDYLGDFSRRHSSRDVIRWLDAARALKVLVVGETVIDEYEYCESMGKSGKEPILAARYVGRERFAGGILAVANHVAGFSDHVGLLTFLGDHDSHESFIHEHLDPNVDKMFLYAHGSPTIVKRRFVEMYPFQKLFELYVMNGEEGFLADDLALAKKLEEVVADYDVVIVADYGHGMLGPSSVAVLEGRASFLSVNTQVNAANRGFHTVSKYPRADYICVSENEIRMEVRSRTRDIRGILGEIGERLHCDQVFITRGRNGCLCHSKQEGFFEVPAFAEQIVDRVGAGDAVLSVTALCAALRAPMEVIGFIGNVVGAEAVHIVGNQGPVERQRVCSRIQGLLAESRYR